MIIVQENPHLYEDLLIHFGVKGMRWGVRKKEDLSSDGSAKSKYLAIPQPTKTTAQLKAATAPYSRNFVDKFDPPDGKSGLSPKQKKALIYGIAGTLAAAAVVGGVYYAKKKGINLSNVNLDAYKAATQQSRLNAINADFITKSSFDRPEFTLSPGHQFFRLSSGVEKGFGRLTYATHTEDDFNRYVAQLGHSLNNKVTFKSKGSVKVSSLTSSLEALREALGPSATHEESLRTYRELVGGKWDSPLAAKFFETLKSKGFNAIIDEMDAGVISESPLVIFDHSPLGKKVTRSMSRSDILRATNLVKDFANRK